MEFKCSQPIVIAPCHLHQCVLWVCLDYFNYHVRAEPMWHWWLIKAKSNAQVPLCWVRHPVCSDHIPSEEGTWGSLMNVLPFVPSEPAGIQHFSFTLSFPPPSLARSLSFSLMSLFPAQYMLMLKKFPQRIERKW